MSTTEKPAPSPNRRRHILITVGVIVVIAIIAFLIRDYVRLFVAPFVLYLLWLGQLLLASLPQALFWAIFLIVAFFLAWRSLATSRYRYVRKEKPANVYYGRVEELARMIEQSDSGEYFARRLERQVSDLTLETLGHGEKLTPTQAQAVLDQVRGRVPGLVASFLERTIAQRMNNVEMMTQYNNRLSALADRVLRPARQESDHATEVALVVAYLEKELEVKGE